LHAKEFVGRERKRVLKKQLNEDGLAVSLNIA